MAVRVLNLQWHIEVFNTQLFWCKEWIFSMNLSNYFLIYGFQKHFQPAASKIIMNSYVNVEPLLKMCFCCWATLVTTKTPIFFLSFFIFIFLSLPLCYCFSVSVSQLPHQVSEHRRRRQCKDEGPRRYCKRRNNPCKVHQWISLMICFFCLFCCFNLLPSSTASWVENKWCPLILDNKGVCNPSVFFVLSSWCLSLLSNVG